MGVESTYAAGDGVLVGAGDVWVLVTDPGDEAVVEDLWAIVSGARPGPGPVSERVLAALERVFVGGPPALALVDLAAGGSATVSRGLGHVRVSGADRILSLDGGADAGARTPRRIVGGVVAASRLTLRPLAQRVAPVVEVTPAAPVTGSPMIDGIPEAILAAKGPDGPPPAPRRRRTTPEDTGSQIDTTEPDPEFISRIEQGGHTTIRPPQQTVPPTPEPANDHEGDLDGQTVHRPEPAAHLRHGTQDTVLAVSCPDGHLTPSDSRACRVCRQPVAPQEPRRLPRPTLGGLRLPTGEVVPLDRGVILGRKPAPAEDSTDWPHLVHLPADHTFVSRMHLRIELDGWNVLARDLDSRGGTMLTVPGRDPERMRGMEAYVIAPGTTLDLAEVYEVRFEVGPVVPR